VDAASQTAGFDLLAAHLSTALTLYQSSTDWAGAARWSPAGSLLAFSADDQKLIVGKVEDTTFTPLWEKAHPDCIDTFDWSPDGSQLACIANGHLAIYNSADGTPALDTVSFQPAGHVSTMSWGRKYIAVFVVGDNNTSNSLLIINPDGILVMEATSSALNASHPFSWSPDGQWLLYAENAGQMYALNVLDSSIPPIPLAQDKGFNREPQWQPVSRSNDIP
jgi:Tol biopolymer transport system component